MSVQINYKNNGSKKPTNNIILFVDEKFNVSHIKKYISNTEFSYINDLLKNCDLSKKILFFELSSKKKIVLISVKKIIKFSDIESLGAELYSN